MFERESDIYDSRFYEGWASVYLKSKPDRERRDRLGDVILMINGSFGVGKSSAAAGLQRRLAGSVVFDPEEVGAMLMSTLRPVEWTGDFQDYPEWRLLVPQVAKTIYDYRQTPLIVPMTIWRTDYFHQIVGPMRSISSQFFHFCLVASEEIIVDRIRKRGHQSDGDWVYEQVPKCVSAFQNPVFEEFIHCESLEPEEVVNVILRRVSESV